MDGKKDLSLVLACYNEEGYLVHSVNQIVDALSGTNLTYEVLFVDDGSSDRTREIINEIVSKNTPNMRKFFNKRNLGRGGAVSRGIQRAKGTYVGFVDLDLEVGAHYIPYCVNELQKGASVATAHRIYKVAFNGLLRAIISKGYRVLVNTVLKLPLKDTETGFKFFTTKDVLPVIAEMKTRGWFWDTEIMARCYKRGLNIVEKECLFIRRKDKKSSVHLFRDSCKYAWSLLKYHKELSI